MEFHAQRTSDIVLTAYIADAPGATATFGLKLTNNGPENTWPVINGQQTAVDTWTFTIVPATLANWKTLNDLSLTTYNPASLGGTAVVHLRANQNGQLQNFGLEPGHTGDPTFLAQVPDNTVNFPKSFRITLPE